MLSDDSEIKVIIRDALATYDQGKGRFRKRFWDSHTIREIRKTFNKSKVTEIDLAQVLLTSFPTANHLSHRIFFNEIIQKIYGSETIMQQMGPAALEVMTKRIKRYGFEKEINNKTNREKIDLARAYQMLKRANLATPANFKKIKDSANLSDVVEILQIIFDIKGLSQDSLGFVLNTQSDDELQNLKIILKELQRQRLFVQKYWVAIKRCESLDDVIVGLEKLKKGSILSSENVRDIIESDHSMCLADGFVLLNEKKLLNKKNKNALKNNIELCQAIIALGHLLNEERFKLLSSKKTDRNKLCKALKKLTSKILTDEIYKEFEKDENLCDLIKKLSSKQIEEIYHIDNNQRRATIFNILKILVNAVWCDDVAVVDVLSRISVCRGALSLGLEQLNKLEQATILLQSAGLLSSENEWVAIRDNIDLCHAVIILNDTKISTKTNFVENYYKLRSIHNKKICAAIIILNKLKILDKGSFDIIANNIILCDVIVALDEEKISIDQNNFAVLGNNRNLCELVHILKESHILNLDNFQIMMGCENPQELVSIRDKIFEILLPTDHTDFNIFIGRLENFYEEISLPPCSDETRSKMRNHIRLLKLLNNEKMLPLFRQDGVFDSEKIKRMSAADEDQFFVLERLGRLTVLSPVEKNSSTCVEIPVLTSDVVGLVLTKNMKNVAKLFEKFTVLANTSSVVEPWETLITGDGLLFVLRSESFETEILCLGCIYEIIQSAGINGLRNFNHLWWRQDKELLRQILGTLKACLDENNFNTVMAYHNLPELYDRLNQIAQIPDLLKGLNPASVWNILRLSSVDELNFKDEILASNRMEFHRLMKILEEFSKANILGEWILTIVMETQFLSPLLEKLEKIIEILKNSRIIRFDYNDANSFILTASNVTAILQHEHFNDLTAVLAELSGAKILDQDTFDRVIAFVDLKLMNEFIKIFKDHQLAIDSSDIRDPEEGEHYQRSIFALQAFDGYPLTKLDMVSIYGANDPFYMAVLVAFRQSNKCVDQILEIINSHVCEEEALKLSNVVDALKMLRQGGISESMFLGREVEIIFNHENQMNFAAGFVQLKRDDILPVDGKDSMLKKVLQLARDSRKPEVFVQALISIGRLVEDDPGYLEVMNVIRSCDDSKALTDALCELNKGKALTSKSLNAIKQKYDELAPTFQQQQLATELSLFAKGLIMFRNLNKLNDEIIKMLGGYDGVNLNKIVEILQRCVHAEDEENSPTKKEKKVSKKLITKIIDLLTSSQRMETFLVYCSGSLPGDISEWSEKVNAFLKQEGEVACAETIESNDELVLGAVSGNPNDFFSPPPTQNSNDPSASPLSSQTPAT